jgi:predicted PurR-regulated permease PerM
MMDEYKKSFQNFFHLPSLTNIYRLLLTIIAVWFLSIIWPFISNVVLMLVFAFLFTTVLLSSVDALERKIGNRALSVLAVVIILLGGIGTFLGSFISQMSQQAAEFSSRIDKETLTQEFKTLGEKFTSAMPDFLQNMQSSNGETAGKLSELINTIVGSLASMAGAIGNFMFIATMVFIFTIILLAEYHGFRKSLVNAIPNKYFEVGIKLIYNIEKSVSSYLRGQFLSAASVAAMSIAGLLLLNLFGANLTLTIFIGIIAGLANLIPLVGPFVGMIPAILIAFMNNIGSETAMAHTLFGVVPSPFYLLDIVLMFLIVQQIEGNLITPALVGKSVGLHPIVVMIALLIGGTILGPLGMLFAVPATGVLKVVLTEIAFVRKNAHLL